MAKIKIKGKKGQLLLYGLIAGLIAAIVISFINNVMDKKDFPIIGDSSLSLMESSIEAEKALIYIDQSAKYSAYQSIYDTARIGGCDNEDAYSGYVLWNVNEQEANPSQCSPSSESAKNIFPETFISNLNAYLPKYKNAELPLNNYDLDFENNDIKGAAKNSLKVKVMEKETELGMYSIKPSFNVDLGNYDFSDYDELGNMAGALILGCKGKNSGMCVDSSKNIFNKGNLAPGICETGGAFFRFLDFRWASDVRYSIYGFCVKSTQNKVYAYDLSDKKVDLRDVKYKFALQLEDLKCTLDDNVNTKCLNELCSKYSSCASAENVCYCTKPLNACEGACLPFCSDYAGLGVPPQLGQPDANGIYKYIASGATPIWYRHIGNGDWQWTPYDPYSTIKCWMPVAETTVSNSCGGKWDGKKPVQANIDIITYLNENKPIPSIASGLITDSDADTSCVDFSCGSYLSCNSISSCGCSPAVNACKGNDCQTLHCSRDSEFESKNSIKTECKDQCSKYGDCSATSLCACDSGLSACQGSCYCNPKPTYTGSCGGEGCKINTRPIYRDYDPKTCHSTEFLGCTACDPSCDPCGCNYGSACDCKGDSCCIEDQSLCPPPPPADNSCQGRCGGQAPNCWCDYPSGSSQGCEFYGDCCSDYSQHCG